MHFNFMLTLCKLDCAYVRQHTPVEKTGEPTRKTCSDLEHSFRPIRESQGLTSHPPSNTFMHPVQAACARQGRKPCASGEKRRRTRPRRRLSRLAECTRRPRRAVLWLGWQLQPAGSSPISHDTLQSPTCKFNFCPAAAPDDRSEALARRSDH